MRISALSAGFVAVALLALSAAASAEPMEIKLGQTMPYSGPASALSAIGKVQTRYFTMINQRGGINGHKVNLISLDDSYNPAKSVEQVRRLVEQDNVVAIFGSMGTATNASVQAYLNRGKVPQLFVFAAGDRFAAPATSPMTIPGMTLFTTEASAYADYVGKNLPNAKVAVLLQNDDFGKEYLAGFKARLAQVAPGAQIVATSAYEATTPTVDSQVISLSSSGADVFLNASTPKFASQAIRKAYDIGWRPLQILPIGSNFVATVLKPAGLEKSAGIISATPTKTVGDPEWKDDPDYLAWLTFMKEYYPEGDTAEQLNFTGYNVAVLMKNVLEACKDDFSRENLMAKAASLQQMKLPGLIPGITASTTKDDYRLIKQLRLQKFDGGKWSALGDIVSVQ
jgi:ABC-type branched-subunit amino acid transport system substrate-binding protein